MVAEAGASSTAVDPRSEASAADAAAVLIVDDDDANLIAFEAILEPLGHRLALVRSGADALRYLLANDVAVILLDVQMPVMTGFEVASMVKAHPRLASVPIIFVTASHRHPAQIFSGYAHGAVDYLLKPVEPEMLRAKVRVFVDLYRHQQTIRAQAQLLHAHELREIERRNDERLRGLTDSMPLPVWVVRHDGVVHACNRAWTEYSGLDAAGTRSIADASWIHPKDRERAQTAWSNGKRRGEPFDLECRLRRAKDGAFRWHLLRAVPEAAAPERQENWVVAGFDVDAQKLVEEERARVLQREHEARTEAEAANRMKDEFLATVSHELRTPLNAILSWARMIRTGMLDAARVAHAVEVIERNARFQARLINDLLDISRILSRKLELNVGQVDLGAVLSEAVDAALPSAEAKEIRLTLERGPAEVPVRGDPARLQQIAQNLLSNAVKFTPKGGAVDVTVRRENDAAVLAVRDTGRGISESFLPHVFDRFRQEDRSFAREHDGLGLGLAIVKHLVELHGGNVVAESAGTGKGTTILVRLPCAAVDVARAPSRDPEVLRPASTDGAGPPQPALHGARVLFVEDQPEARELVAEVLSRFGASVVAVETADEALRSLHARVPDVLISDVGLPGMDGYALIRCVRALPPVQGGNVPAIALTAYARPEDRRRARDEGFQVHMAKPVEPDELVALVASLVRPAPAPAR